MTTSRDFNRWLPLVLMVGVLLIAGAVRWHHIDAQSLWYDEGTTVGRAARTVPELITVMQNNIHPPGYFMLISIYEDFAGNSEFALRTFSTFWALISIALTFALGRRLFGNVAGIAAALFTALNTFNIYYAQEARMYTLLAALTAASMLSLVILVDTLTNHPDDRRRWLIAGGALAVLNAIGIYTHYIYPFMMLAQGVLAVLWLVWLMVTTDFKQTLRAGAVYAGANLLTVALFLPWLPIALRQIGGHGNLSENEPFAEMMRVLQGWLTFGPTYEMSMGGMGVVGTLLAVFGLVMLPSQAKRQWWRLLVPVIWVIVPVVAFLSLELFSRYLRFLTPLQLAFALWMGRGVWVLWHIQPRRKDSPVFKLVPRFAAIAITILFTLGMARGLAPLYDDPQFQRDDYRGLVQTIMQAEQTDDGILVSSAGLQEIIGYYYTGDAPILGLPGSFNAPDTAERTRDFISAHDRIFTVFYGNLEQDPENVIETTLNTVAFEADDRWFDDMRLVTYVAPPADWAVTETQPVTFGDVLTLADYHVSATDARAGDTLAVQLTWQVDAPLPERYKIFVQLLNPDGTLSAQHDSEPAGGLLPTDNWSADTAISDHHGIIIPDDAPAGTYQLIAGVYSVNDPAQRLPVNDADALTLAEIVVE